jgi:hypothetical protein
MCAGIYAKTVYQTSLANVDWLHGTSEALLTITNLMIGTTAHCCIRTCCTELGMSLTCQLHAVAGLRQGIWNAETASFTEEAEVNAQDSQIPAEDSQVSTSRSKEQ